MSRSVRRIAVALLLGAALAPTLAVASPSAVGSGARSVPAAFQLSWEPLERLWSWLTAGRPSPPVRPTEGCSIDPYGHCNSGN